MLGLNDGARLALVIDSDDFVPELELATLARGREGLQYGELALAIDSMAVVQVGHTGNVDGLLARIEISDLLVGELEGY